MIFLALYDERGQCQRIARTNNRSDANQFLTAGFVEVSREEYERCEAIAQPATIDELSRLQQARQLAQQIRQAQPQRLQVQLNLDALERLRERQSDYYRDITQQRLDGDISPERWERLFIDRIIAGNTAATAIGKGGITTLNAEDVQLIERDNQTQLDYLNRYKRDFDNLSPATALNRATLYSGAVTSRYWTAHTRALGLPLLPAMPGVRTTCGSNCKCNWNIIELPGDGELGLSMARISSRTL